MTVPRPLLAVLLAATACTSSRLTVSGEGRSPLPQAPHVVPAALPPEPPPPTDLAGVPVALLQGCDGGDAEACTEACRLYVNPSNRPGTSGLQRGTVDKGIGFCRKGCDAGAPAACGMLGFLHLYGLAVPQSSDKARSLLEDACGRGFLPACDNLGVLYMGDHGVPKDNKKAYDILSRACGKGDGHACANLASVVGEGWPGSPPDTPRSLQLSLTAC